MLYRYTYKTEFGEYIMFLKKYLYLMLIVIIPLFLLHCKDDNPVDDDESEHAEAEGLIITSPTDTVFIYKEGTVTGTLQIKTGQTSPMLTVQFYDADGDVFQPDTDHHQLGYEISNTSFLQLIEQTGTPWQFVLKGLTVGSTNFRIKILHEGHDDFVSGLMPVTVIP